MSDNNHSIQEQIVTLLFKDRRVERRWRNIRWAGWLILLLFYALLLFSNIPFGHSEKSIAHSSYVSLIRLNGIIDTDHLFSSETVIPELQKAFADNKAKGVVLLINSPGGSPVQASIIHDKILALKKKYKKKVVVVGEDSLASGAYLVSTAADKIYVNPDTLTGSIGVVMTGFGFVDTIKKIGVTRRLFTAGKNKHRLDPFSPLQNQDVSKIKNLLNEVHQHFIAAVIAGRGKRLKGDRHELFSGDFWTGTTATKLGIVDGTADLWTVLENEFHVKHYRDYTTKPSLFSLLHRVSSQLNLNLFNHVPLQEKAY